MIPLPSPLINATLPCCVYCTSDHREVFISSVSLTWHIYHRLRGVASNSAVFVSFVFLSPFFFPAWSSVDMRGIVKHRIGVGGSLLACLRGVLVGYHEAPGRPLDLTSAKWIWDRGCDCMDTKGTNAMGRRNESVILDGSPGRLCLELF